MNMKRIIERYTIPIFLVLLALSLVEEEGTIAQMMVLLSFAVGYVLATIEQKRSSNAE